MSDISNTILRDIEDDVSISSKDISVEVAAKGVLKRKRLIRLTGTVSSEAEKRKAGQIATHHAGNSFEVVNDLAVK